jgi:hypothetical protein
MAAFVLNTLKTQLPLLIEKYEPEIEGKLRESLRTIKMSNPSESQLFLTNWVKLNKAVQEELGGPTPVMGGKKRKTRKHKKRT